MPKFTKTAIMQSFVKLLDSTPFDRITVKDIVDDCGVNRNTFYYNFEDIYALVDELLIACVFLGAAIGGAAAAKKRGKSALASGLIAGAVLAALLAVGSLMAEGEAALSADCLRHAIAAVAGGLFGGALCLNRRAAKRKKRGRRR